MKTRELIDLKSVGKATLEDFHTLEIYKVDDLIGKDARELYEQLKKIKNLESLDRCCEDVFKTAIMQAENPNLPEEQKDWFYWSKVRKANSD